MSLKYFGKVKLGVKYQTRLKYLKKKKMQINVLKLGWTIDFG